VISRRCAGDRAVLADELVHPRLGRVPSPDSSRSRPWVSPVVIDNDFAVWRSFDNHFGRGGAETNKANDCTDGKCDSGATSEIAAHVGAKCQAADSQRQVP
jgi:hypothetical protein